MRSHLVTVSRVVLAVLAMSIAAGCGAAKVHAQSTDAQAVEANVVPFLFAQLAAYAGPEGPYVAGTWKSTNNVCWACDNGGPATAAATLYVLTGRSRPVLLDQARQTIDTAIATRQGPDGAFSGPRGDTQSAGVATMFFGVELGTAYRLLAPSLSAATRARWQRSLASAAGYLVAAHDVTWYANGNINLGYTELLYLAWQATGDTTLEQDYEDSWAFTLDPPQARFPGAGLVTVRNPTLADGANGDGYLAEIGPGGTGFDAEYSSLQLDVACRLYLLSGDPRALRLANLLLNVLMPRVNTSSWMLATDHGTRHTQADRHVGFITAAFAVLGFDGGRSDLAHYALPQLLAEEAWYPQPGQADSGVFRRAIGNSVALVALAAAQPGVPATAARLDR